MKRTKAPKLPLYYSVRNVKQVKNEMVSYEALVPLKLPHGFTGIKMKLLKVERSKCIRLLGAPIGPW